MGSFDETLQTMRAVKIFQNERNHVSSVDMVSDGSLALVSSSHDRTVTVYSFNSFGVSSLVTNKRYGIDAVRFVNNETVIHSCRKRVEDKYNIRMLSLGETKYIRSFAVHQERVLQLAASRVDNMFLSSSADGVSYVWDNRVEMPQMSFDLNELVLLAFGNKGEKFALLSPDGTLRLYETRSYVAGPCVISKLGPLSATFNAFRSMAYSTDDCFLLITTTIGHIFVINVADGFLYRTFTGFAFDHTCPVNACFVPENYRVMSGSLDGSICVWPMDDARDLPNVARMPKYRLPCSQDSVSCVLYHPQHSMFLSAGRDTSFWLPDNN